MSKDFVRFLPSLPVAHSQSCSKFAIILGILAIRQDLMTSFFEFCLPIHFSLKWYENEPGPIYRDINSLINSVTIKKEEGLKRPKKTLDMVLAANVNFLKNFFHIS